MMYLMIMRISMPSDTVLAKTASLFAAFANEGRLRALVALSAHGPLAVATLEAVCGLEQSALSHQLRILRTSSLVVTERRGKQIWYDLADDHIRTMLNDGMHHAAERSIKRKKS
jgi:ArsR family transcriptional regulator, lead/cadmium/zinc/bismuth-responsive transcriptional repressor